MLSPSDHNAVECYHKAAKAGHADAQYNLALFYEEGAGRCKIFSTGFLFRSATIALVS